MVLLSLFPSFASSSRLQAVPLRGLGYGIISEPERRDLVADLGFSWVKHLVYWKDAQPQRGGPISFDPYDEWVDRARALGLRSSSGWTTRRPGPRDLPPRTHLP